MALKIADKEFTSRLFTGTGKFASNQLMEDAILASESQLVTVALKRVNMDGKNDDILAHLKAPHITLLPNTSGVRTAKEAVFAAQLAREALGTNWLKLEIHPDPKYLLPDPIETLKRPRNWQSWDSWCYPTFKPIRYFANTLKMPGPLP